MKNSQFRHWLNEKWFEHKDEVLLYGGHYFLSSDAYFAKYKWWLKTVYQKERQEQIRREAARKKYG